MSDGLDWLSYMPHHDQLIVIYEADLGLYHNEITQRINHHIAWNATNYRVRTYVQLRTK